MDIKRGVLKSLIREWDDEKKIEVWNARCDSANCTDDEIYWVDSFEDDMEEFFPGNLTAVLHKLRYGDFNFEDEYWCFNGYANFVSFSYLDNKESPYDEEEVIDYIEGDANSDDVADWFEDDMEAMEEAFIDHYFPLHQIEARAVLNEGYHNLATDDWEEVSEEIADAISERM